MGRKIAFSMQSSNRKQGQSTAVHAAHLLTSTK
jgi:hypothetical protein